MKIIRNSAMCVRCLTEAVCLPKKSHRCACGNLYAFGSSGSLYRSQDEPLGYFNTAIAAETFEEQYGVWQTGTYRTINGVRMKRMSTAQYCKICGWYSRYAYRVGNIWHWLCTPYCLEQHLHGTKINS